MTGKWIYAGAIALMALCTEQAAARQEIVLHDVNGKEMKAALRKALPVEAPRVRYPGFKQETLVLKKGSIRREGTRPLPCDILMERDVPVKLRGKHSDKYIFYTLRFDCSFAAANTIKPQLL